MPNWLALSFDWDVSQYGWRGGVLVYLGAVMKLDKSLLKCTANNGLLMVSTAQAVATYIQANGAKIASVTEDIRIFTGVFLAGGATALEYLGAVAAVMSAADWTAMMLTLGITVGTAALILNCALNDS